jgi:hypothetical protein
VRGISLRGAANAFARFARTNKIGHAKKPIVLAATLPKSAPYVRAYNLPVIASAAGAWQSTISMRPFIPSPFWEERSAFNSLPSPLGQKVAHSAG